VLDEVAKDGFQVLDRRLSLPPARKLWIAVRTWLAA
jgi:phytoene synthase